MGFNVGGIERPIRIVVGILLIGIGAFAGLPAVGTGIALTWERWRLSPGRSDFARSGPCSGSIPVRRLRSSNMTRGGWFAQSWAQKWTLFVAGLCVGSLVSCATSDHVAANLGKKALVGKSEAAVIACAGQPMKHMVMEERVRMVYRNEPDVLERSFPTAKGSMPCPHHGCEAWVMLQQGTVTDVEYHPFPEGCGACDHCDRIFAKCGGE